MSGACGAGCDGRHSPSGAANTRTREEVPGTRTLARPVCLLDLFLSLGAPGDGQEERLIEHVNHQRNPDARGRQTEDRPRGELADSMNRIPRWYRRSSLSNGIVTGVLFPWWLRLCTQVLVAALLGSAAHAQAPQRLWVLQRPDELVEYDVTTFAARRTLKVPRRLLEQPEYLSINAMGQMVFLPPKDEQWASGELATAGDRAWFWDGHQAKEWQLAGPQTRGGSAGTPTVTDTARQWFLSAGGESLVWVEQRFEQVMADPSLERAVRATARVWCTDLAGSRPEPIASLSAPG